MKFIKQTQWDTCASTVLACLLDLTPEDVPNFNEGLENTSKSWEPFHTRRQEWLAKRGLRMVNFNLMNDLETVNDIMRTLNPGVYYFLVGESYTEGQNHTVICLDGEIIWDPSPTEEGIAGPALSDDGNKHYGIEIVVPLWHTAPRNENR